MYLLIYLSELASESKIYSSKACIRHWLAYTKAAKKEDSHVHDYLSLPSDKLQAIKPIYKDFLKDELLQRCVRSFTQNNNESFKQNVWKVIPKNLPASFKTVSIRAYIATCVFNEGTYGLLALLHGIGISCGSNAHTTVIKLKGEFYYYF